MTARGVLKALRWIERIACVLSFTVIAAALIADVGSRLLQGAGILGAVQVGVAGMVVLAMFGIGLASDAGEHLRPRYFDALWPETWRMAVQRIADALTALFFLVFGIIAVLVVAESYALGDVTSVLRWPIWPLQCAIALAFLLNALRYVIFAGRPDLRPDDESRRVPGVAAKEGM